MKSQSALLARHAANRRSQTPSPSLSLYQRNISNQYLKHGASAVYKGLWSTARPYIFRRTVMGKLKGVEWSIMGVRASKLGRIIGRRGSYKRLGGSAMVPRGYVPVCVGVNDETKRFIVHTTMLCEDDFMKLLYMAAEEYGFCNEGVLRIPYEAKDFEEWMLGRAKKKRVKPT